MPSAPRGRQRGPASGRHRDRRRHRRLVARRSPLHLWGWDGAHTALPNGLDRRLRRLGRRTRCATATSPSLDVALPDGEHDPPGDRAPAPPTAPRRWLRALPPADAASELASPGSSPSPASPPPPSPPACVTPVVRDERDMPVARWVPVADATRRRRARPRSAAAMPPICARPATRATVADIHAALVDGVARHRLADRRLAPGAAVRSRPPTSAPRARCSAPWPTPTRRSSAARSPTPTRSTRSPPASTATTAGCAASPSSCPQVRLVVPDDPFDDWEVRLELVDELDPGRWCTRRRRVGPHRRWPSSSPAATDHIDALAGEVADARRARSPSASTSPPSCRRPRSRRRSSSTVEDAERFLEQAPAELDRLGIDAASAPSASCAPASPCAARATPATAADHGRRLRARGHRRLAAGRRRRRRPGRDHRRRARPRRARPGRRCCTPAGAGCASTRPRCAGPASGSTSTAASTPSSTPSRCCASPATARSTRGASAARSWTDELLAGLPDERLVEEHERAGFVGELRPYQRRGLGWLRFLERLGLGGCLADDMGLGKTATTLAHLLDRPGPAPRRVPAVGRPQLGGRGGPLHAVAARRRPPRRRARPRDATSSAGADLVVTTYGLLPRDLDHLAAVAWSTVVARRGADDQEPGDARRQGRCGR